MLHGTKMVMMNLQPPQGSTIVLFDGCPEEQLEKSTNSVERLRRAKRRTTSEVIFNELVIILCLRNNFCLNDSNNADHITDINAMQLLLLKNTNVLL
ncbi:hypothetical protein AVEN_166448-1 [Araneus ventricosus]|uniref:Uncharacterized protein n=1 Tax=Araneus ventricosus TaxID=182803 RepID=A0A4Y2EZP3_ARAVE|nr:hypothetical protein AVEN_166448-1 [Araneus ventricosus]